MKIYTFNIRVGLVVVLTEEHQTNSPAALATDLKIKYEAPGLPVNIVYYELEESKVNKQGYVDTDRVQTIEVKQYHELTQQEKEVNGMAKALINSKFGQPSKSKVVAIKIPAHIYEIEKVGTRNRDYLYTDSLHTMAEILGYMVQLYKNSSLSEIATAYEETTTFEYGGQAVDTKARLKNATAFELEAMATRLKVTQSTLSLFLLAMFFANVK